jgi:DNA helicase II / ATP-dependent DNA helicase PcrA
MTAAPYLSRLNPEQRQAVEHGGPSPLLIIAGAGTGKTNTLAHRVAHLIVLGADPRRIVLLTFSRRAAVEMIRRVERIAANVLPDQARIAAGALSWSGTFHAIGARLLREYAEHVGLDRQFTIHDREDSADLMNLVRHDLGFSKTEERFPAKSTCLAIYSRAINAEAALDELLGKNFPWCAGWEDELKTLFGAYVEAKQRQNVLDYDDLLLYWAQMMQVDAIARDIGSRFDHVLVDEYQDTNRLQASILVALKPDGKGLTVVGDDAQSIYSFRAATVRNILDFPQLFTPPAHIVTLDRNYRSTSRSSRPPMRSSISLPSVTKRTCDRNVLPPNARSSCRFATRPTKRAMWPSGSWSTAKLPSRSSSKPCYSARRIIAPHSRSN